MNPVGHRYAKSPLTEATIEYRLQEPLSDKDLTLVHRRFKQLKHREEELTNLTFRIVKGEPQVASKELSHYKLTASDGSEIIQIGRTNLSLSVLAPYPGWEEFIGRSWELYSLWRRDVGIRRPLRRIGLRYINRFDIPDNPEEPTYPIGRYLNFKSVEPEILDDPVRLYEVTVHTGIRADKLGVNLSSVSVASPLIGHSSLTLDIDIFRDAVDVPQTEPEIKALLNLIRQRRSEIFEACITDATRALIS